MAKRSALELKRKEAKEEILAMKETIPVVRLLNFLGGGFKSQSLGYWLMNFVLLNLITLGPMILIDLVLFENANTSTLLLPTMIAVENVILSAMLAYVTSTSSINDLVNEIVGKINRVEDISSLHQWAGENWSMQRVLKFSAGFCLLVVLVIVGGYSIRLNEFVGIGVWITTIITGLLLGLSFYGFWLGVSEVSAIKDYQYEINTILPAESAVIDSIDRSLMRSIYMVSAFLTVLTLEASSSFLGLIDRQFTVMSYPILILGWTAITVMFFVIRSAENHIVNNAKWKTLDKINVQINAIEAKGDLADGKTSERLSRLVDIYRQVYESRIDTLSLKSLSSLFSQLMFPLLGLLLGDIDKIKALFQK